MQPKTVYEIQRRRRFFNNISHCSEVLWICWSIFGWTELFHKWIDWQNFKSAEIIVVVLHAFIINSWWCILNKNTKTWITLFYFCLEIKPWSLQQLSLSLFYSFLFPSVANVSFPRSISANWANYMESTMIKWQSRKPCYFAG